MTANVIEGSDLLYVIMISSSSSIQALCPQINRVGYIKPILLLKTLSSITLYMFKSFLIVFSLVFWSPFSFLIVVWIPALFLNMQVVVSCYVPNHLSRFSLMLIFFFFGSIFSHVNFNWCQPEIISNIFVTYFIFSRFTARLHPYLETHPKACCFSNTQNHRARLVLQLLYKDNRLT